MALEQINAQVSGQAPIHDLPDEILEEIFLVNTFQSVKQGNKQQSYDPHSTTLATAQVCRRWHAVALGFPTLWSRIIDYERHPAWWIETLLTRSGSSLIDVGGDSIFEPIQIRIPRGKPVLESIFKRITLLKSFNLNIRLSPWELFCRSFLGRPASNLEFLSLSTSCPFPDCFYPDPLFADEAPCLRRLYLQRCLIDFSSSVLSNLTVLSVRDVIAPYTLSSSALIHLSNPAPNVTGWLRVLQNIPLLQFLTLSSAISHFTEEGPLPVVDLPNLALLTINARFNHGMPLINHLKIPLSCGIRFGLTHSRFGDASDGPKLLSFLVQQVSHLPQDHPDRYLKAQVLSGNRIHFGNSKHIGRALNMSEPDEVEAHSLSSMDPILSLVLVFDSCATTFEFFNQLLELYSFTFSTTTTLELWLDQEFEHMATTSGHFTSLNAFHSFTNLKTLQLLDQSPLFLLPLFQNSSLHHYPLFPALQSLCLVTTYIDYGQSMLSAALDKFLQWRTEVGVSLPEIKISARHASKEVAEDILRQVDNT